MDETLDQSLNATSILLDQLTVMGEGAIQMLPSLVIALLVFVLTWIVARFAGKIADRLTSKAQLRASLAELVDTMVRVEIWIVGLMATLTILLPGMTPGSLIAGLGFGAVAIGFAFQDIFENFLAGVLIMLREKMRIGDFIDWVQR